MMYINIIDITEWEDCCGIIRNHWKCQLSINVPKFARLSLAYRHWTRNESSTSFCLFQNSGRIWLCFCEFSVFNISLVSSYLSQNRDQLFVDLWFIGVRRINSKIPVAFREIRIDDGTFHHNFLFKPTSRQIHIRRWHHFSGILSSLLGGLSFFFNGK